MHSAAKEVVSLSQEITKVPGNKTSQAYTMISSQGVDGSSRGATLRENPLVLSSNTTSRSTPRESKTISGEESALGSTSIPSHRRNTFAYARSAASRLEETVSTLSFQSRMTASRSAPAVAKADSAESTIFRAEAISSSDAPLRRSSRTCRAPWSETCAVATADSPSAKDITGGFCSLSSACSAAS